MLILLSDTHESYLLIHHARAAGRRDQTPGTGGAAQPLDHGFGYRLCRDVLRGDRQVGLATHSWLTPYAPASIPSCRGLRRGKFHRNQGNTI